MTEMSEGVGIASHSAAAYVAAQRVASRLGLDGAGMQVLHSSNNTIIHLPACRLVAKVGTAQDGSGTLERELDIAIHLAARGAEIAPPVSHLSPGPYRENGLDVTLWHFLEHLPEPELDDDELAGSLGRLHASLATWGGDLPDYRERIQQTGRLLEDESEMRALPPAGLSLLRDRFAQVAPELLDLAAPRAVLHGGPHFRNVLMTPNGLRWIDFETCCRGPIEADLAYLGDAGAHRRGIDLVLLALAKRMLQISVATTCWRDPDRHPHLREAAEYHLARLADQPGG